jgi:Tol biopolymer transport system component
MGGLLVPFFSAMALLLGAGGFEPESRNDAWAYLFSRPIGKGAVWAVKYLSLLSQLACLWLIFLAAMLTFPGFRALVGGFRLPIVYGTELSFLPWCLLISFFLFTLAFSLSPFSNKWLNLLFGALFMGLILVFIAYWASTLVTVLLRDEWLDEKKWLHAFRWSLILMGAASAWASLRTLTRADFSQPRKKIARFAAYAAPFLVAALALAAAWTALLPRTGDRFVSMIGHSGGETYFQTERGIFAYNWSEEKVTRLARGQTGFGESTPVRSGKVVFYDVDVSLKRYKATVLWSMNTDGSQKMRLTGGGFKPDDPRSRLSPYRFLLSPDGKRIVFIDEDNLYGTKKGESQLWAINVDGSDLVNLPVPQALAKEHGNEFWLNFVAWPAVSPSSFLLLQRSNGPQGQSTLWLYDLRVRSCRVLIDDARLIWYGAISPEEDRLVLPSRTSPDVPWRLNVLDLRTLDSKTPAVREIETPGWRFAFRPAWSTDGDKLAVFARQGRTPGKGSYALIVVSMSERKVLASKELTDSEKAAQSCSLAWLEGDARLILSNPTERTVSILRPDLSEEKRIPIPASMGSPFRPIVTGDKALFVDGERNRLWRLDLKTGSWKRVF